VQAWHFAGSLTSATVQVDDKRTVFTPPAVLTWQHPKQSQPLGVYAWQ